MKKVVIHTDGACHGNPGPGGWAATLEYGEHKRELSGGVAATTNNRMELQGAIEALGALKEACAAEFYTDSEYVKNGVLSWMANWKRNGWMTKARKPVKNEDLWRLLDAEVSRHQIEWHWVKGHAGHAGNERCDELATEAVAKIKESLKPEELKAALQEFEATGKRAEPELGLG
jgi:ribonuclease HI